jgi:phenylalanyl-tRNA synthetase alpha chain
MYILTIEGKNYLENGLPERRLIESINNGAVPIVDLKGQGIAINWARKNGWIEIREGKVRLTGKGKEALREKTAIELALFEISEGHDISGDIMKVLENRKLVAAKKLGVTIQGNIINQLTSKMIVSQAWKKHAFRKYDVKAPAPELFAGKKQAYLAFLDEVKEELVSMGFAEMEGPTVESVFYNCDALYMPQDHPSRDVHDIYYVNGKAVIDKKLLSKVRACHENGVDGSKGWGGKFSNEKTSKLLLRSQGTALSARTLANNPNVPGKYFAVARCYRPDVIDATHATEFNQLEGIVLGKKVNFRNLLGMITTFAKRVAGVDKIKFLPGYFPYTEPSTEGYIYHPKLKKWIEILPAGMLRPEVTKPLGINVPVMAWGFGIPRLFMIREGITDIRDLFSYDLEWLRKRRV